MKPTKQSSVTLANCIHYFFCLWQVWTCWTLKHQPEHGSQLFMCRAHQRERRRENYLTHYFYQYQNTQTRRRIRESSRLFCMGDLCRVRVYSRASDRSEPPVTHISMFACCRCMRVRFRARDRGGLLCVLVTNE